MKAMIFAAGRGTRLADITDYIPKALIEINGKTALQIAVEKLSSHGFDDIIINIHHHPGKMTEAINRLREQGYRLTVSDESGQLLETGGGLYKARWFFDDRPFLLYNVDILTDIDLNELYSYHLEKKGIATLAVRNADDPRVFLTDINGIIKGWKNKSTGEMITAGKPGEHAEKAFSGIHIAEPALFSYMNEGFYSLTNLYLSIMQNERIFTYLYNPEFFFDIGSPEELKNAIYRFKGF